jgi:phage shock protein A
LKKDTMKVSNMSAVSWFVIMFSTLANTNTVTMAFAPSHHTSAAGGPAARLSSQQQSMSFWTSPTPSSSVNGSSSSSTTALHANLFDRFTRVTKANLNNVLQKFEDPEKVMNQALEDMQNDLVRIRQTYADVTGTQRRMGQSQRQLESQAADWYQRAQLALSSNNEGLAREALARREALLNQAKAIQVQIENQSNNIDTLYEGMLILEKKIIEANGKKAQMAARARTAKSTQKINDMLSGLTGKTSMDAFNRMEEKVLGLEASAEVSAEMVKTMMYLPNSSSTKKVDSASGIELQFRMLEASDSVERELEKLKMDLLPSGSKPLSKEQKIPIMIKDLDYLSQK